MVEVSFEMGDTRGVWRVGVGERKREMVAKKNVKREWDDDDDGGGGRGILVFGLGSLGSGTWEKKTKKKRRRRMAF